MPPKRNLTKRKASSPLEEETSETAVKKRKVSPASSQPTNKTLPENIKFPERIPGTVRIASLNVAGLAASIKKGLLSYVEAEDPDILVLTENKVNVPQDNPAFNQRFAHQYWSLSNKKGYAGTAILSKHKPLSVDTTLPGHPDPDSVKGRIVTLEYEHCYVIGTYVVNAGQGLKTLDAKNEWNKHFEAYIRELDKKKPVIWTGDFNVAPTAMDLKNPKPNWNKTAGYTEAETTAFARILNPPEDVSANKFVDIWRRLHPSDNQYTYFSYMRNCRENGTGWRLDMFVLSERLVDRVKMCEIRSEIYGASDHCPVTMEIEGEL